MNYYPNNNFYQNYPYAATIQGKVVDNVDIVKNTEVPFGGFAVFPKGDLSEVYVKSWNNNGTTQIRVYKPVETEEVKTLDPHQELLDKINMLSEKIDKICGNAAIAPANQNSTPVTPVAAKDVRVNAY